MRQGRSARECRASGNSNVSRRAATRHAGTVTPVEPLESRQLLSAANVFATFDGNVASPGATAAIPIQLTRENFTLNGGDTVIGLHLRPSDGTLNPASVRVRNTAGKLVTPEHRLDNVAGGTDSLNLVRLARGNYTLEVSGDLGTSGGFALDVFLAGDADGDRDVDAADGTSIQGRLNSVAGDARYLLAADSDRDGRITGFDLAQQRRNLGDATRVNPLSVTIGLSPAPTITLTDGSLLTGAAAINVVGLANAGAAVTLDQDGDGFDDGTTPAAGTTGLYTLPAVQSEGANILRVAAADTFGQRRTAAVSTTLDTQAPLVAIDAPAPGLETDANVTVSGRASDTPAGLATVQAQVDSGPFVDLAFDPATGAFSLPTTLPLDGSADGLHTVRVRATDRAGNVSAAAEVSFTLSTVTGIREISPANGEEMVGLERETIVRFDDRVDPATVTANSFYLIAKGQRLPGTIRVSPTERFASFFQTGALPSSTEVRVVVDGDQIMARNGKPLDADNDGQAGGVATADFRTLPLTRINGTNVFGYVYDSYNKNPDGSNIPIVGATIRVDAFPQANAVTDANGFFELRDMPAPEFFVHIDGTTAVNAPAGTIYPSVGKPFHSIPGQRTQLVMDGAPFHVYLPPMAMADVVTLSPTVDTEVGFGASGKSTLQTLFPEIDPAVWDKMQVTYPAGSAVDKLGNQATQATVIPVPPDRLPAPLPPGQEPKLVISVQAIGATNFDTPAPVTFPNLEGLQRGEKSLIWSFNHDAGRWEVIGTGSVTEDGLTIVSAPGVGILAPGWHFTLQGTVEQQETPCPPNDFNCIIDDDRVDSDGNLGLAERVKYGLILDGVRAVMEAAAVTYAARNLELPNFTASELMRRFAKGDAPPEGFTFDTSSDVSRIAAGDKVFKKGDSALQTKLFEALNAKLANGGQPTAADVQAALQTNNFKPDFAKSEHPVLFWGFGGTQGSSVSADLNYDGSTWNGTLKYTVNDDYGFSTKDVVTKSGLGEIANNAAHQLQTRGGAKWFPTRIVIEVPVRGVPGPAPAPRLDRVLEAQIVNAMAAVAPSTLAAGLNIVVEAGTPLDVPVSNRRGFGNSSRVYYRYELDNGFELAGLASSSGSLQTFISPETDYIATFYSPLLNSWSRVSGRSNASGSFEEAQLELTEFGGVDTDSDGVPDVGELVIGTFPFIADSDGDGLSDASELEQGLDPTDGRAFPSGVISSLPLPGTSNAVAVDGDNIYVATGSHGLAIVDASQFNNPILLGQMDLSGDATDVAVDGRLGRAVVATNTGGVQIIDVSDPMDPKIAHVVTNVLAGRVEVADGVAYVTRDNVLIAIDLLTGTVLQSLTLPGSGTVTGLTREHDRLYAFVSGSDTFSVVDIANEGGAFVQGQTNVSIASFDVGVSAGNGVAWLAGSGLRTIDISNPATPRLIRGADSFFTARRIALNGSGLGVLAPDGNAFLEVYDTRNTSNTNNRLLQVPLSGAARDVAISRGIAYAAAGGRLEVVNYLPFDNRGAAPTATISTAVADTDPNTPGVQVVEGGSVPIRADINDDVQVRNVELLVNGQVVANDVSFPFDFSAVALSDDPTSPVLTVQVRATDTGGNVALSNLLTIDLVPDTFAPAVASVTPAEGGQVAQGHRAVRVRFSEPIDSAGVTADNFGLVGAGPDGLFDTGDDVLVAATVQLRDGDQLVQMTTDPLAVGLYQLRVNEAAVTDRAGNALGAGAFVSGFEVIEAVPVLVNFNAGFGAPRSYTESGLSILSRQDHVHFGNFGGDASSDLMNHSGCCSTPYQFTFAGGAPFTLVSLDLVQAFGAGTFTSSSGATVSITGTGPITFDPAGWSNITSFSWDQPSGQAAIDNLLILAAPSAAPAVSRLASVGSDADGIELLTSGDTDESSIAEDLELPSSEHDDPNHEDVVADAGGEQA